jgi:hypothetical protein
MCRADRVGHAIRHGVDLVVGIDIETAAVFHAVVAEGPHHHIGRRRFQHALGGADGGQQRAFGLVVRHGVLEGDGHLGTERRAGLVVVEHTLGGDFAVWHDHRDVVEGDQVRGSPVDFDHAAGGVVDADPVADAERSFDVQGDAAEEVADHPLQREADDDAHHAAAQQQGPDLLFTQITSTMIDAKLRTTSSRTRSTNRRGGATLVRRWTTASQKNTSISLQTSQAVDSSNTAVATETSSGISDDVASPAAMPMTSIADIASAAVTAVGQKSVM